MIVYIIQIIDSKDKLAKFVFFERIWIILLIYIINDYILHVLFSSVDSK